MTPEQLATIEAYSRSATRFHETIAQLSNYNHTYDFLLSHLCEGDSLLDLACGTGNISRYLVSRKNLTITGFDLSEGMLKIARESVPAGNFANRSIIDFSTEKKFNGVVNGFGLPYLNAAQAVQSIKNSSAALVTGGIFYLSFMEGEIDRDERPSFNHDVTFHIYYHQKEKIKTLLESEGFEMVHEWQIDYAEEDGSVTVDNVMIARKG